MKIVYLAISLFLFTVSNVKAQQASLTIGLGKPLETRSSSAIAGSPYLNSNFQNCEVLTPGNHTLTNVPLRYNIYTQALEYMVNNQAYDVTDSVMRFSYTDSAMQVNTFLKPAAFFSKNGKTIYYKLLVKGNYSLLESYQAEITTDEDWYTKKLTKKYIIKSEYFLLEGNKLTQLGTNKKSFMAAFNNNSTIREQVDKQTPDFKDESSLITFFKVLNQ
jgi:hypothetical protein